MEAALQIGVGGHGGAQLEGVGNPGAHDVVAHGAAHSGDASDFLQDPIEHRGGVDEIGAEAIHCLHQGLDVVEVPHARELAVDGEGECRIAGANLSRVARAPVGVNLYLGARLVQVAREEDGVGLHATDGGWKFREDEEDAPFHSGAFFLGT